MENCKTDKLNCNCFPNASRNCDASTIGAFVCGFSGLARELNCIYLLVLNRNVVQCNLACKRDRELKMLTQDLKIINDVRLLSLNARDVYEELSKRLSNQQARNVLKRLAKHRMEIVRAIANEGNAKAQCDQLSESVPESIRNENTHIDLDDENLVEAIPSLIARERREIMFLRNEVKRIKNYTLRYRLSSFVATLQMDFDQLQSLAAVTKTGTNGDGK